MYWECKGGLGRELWAANGVHSYITGDKLVNKMASAFLIPSTAMFTKTQALLSLAISCNITTPYITKV